MCAESIPRRSRSTPATPVLHQPVHLIEDAGMRRIADSDDDDDDEEEEEGSQPGSSSSSSDDFEGNADDTLELLQHLRHSMRSVRWRIAAAAPSTPRPLLSFAGPGVVCPLFRLNPMGPLAHKPRPHCLVVVRAQLSPCPSACVCLCAQSYSHLT